MKIDLNLPSVGIGLLAGMALPALPLAAMGFLAYSTDQIPWVAGSILSLGAMAALVLSHAPKETKSSSNEIRDHLRERFPTVAPTSVNWHDVDSSLKPDEWLFKVGGRALRKARTAFERQVSEPIDQSLLATILASLRPLIEGQNDGRWGLEELARRRWSAHETGNAFDLADFMRAMRTHYPKVDFSAPLPFNSPFDLVNVVSALEAARKHGVVPASDFLWLRLLDTRTWYAIDNVGRSTFHVEALGIAAHCIAQASSEDILRRPAVDAALEGVRSYHESHGLPLRWDETA